MGVIHSLMDIWAAETSSKVLNSHWLVPKHRTLGSFSRRAIWLLPPLMPASVGGLPRGAQHGGCLPTGRSDHNLSGRLRCQLVAFLISFFYYLAHMLKCPFKLIIIEPKTSSERNIVTVRYCFLTWVCLKTTSTFVLSRRPLNETILRFDMVSTVKKFACGSLIFGPQRTLVKNDSSPFSIWTHQVSDNL